MKVIVTEKEKVKDIEFPCLMKYDDVIILATEINGTEIKGTVVSKCVHGIGYYATDWYAPSFKPFNGTITLQNDQP